MRATIALLTLLAITPLAQAKSECEIDLGQGWPPATLNHGTAVEGLLTAGAVPVLSLMRLPIRGKENGVMLMRPVGTQPWTLRAAVAAERVDTVETVPGGMLRTLSTEKPAKLRQSDMPAALAERLVASWARALQVAVPSGRNAVFQEGELLVFNVNGQRITGSEPGCGPGRLLARQAQILVEAAGAKDKHLPKHWGALIKSLNQLDAQLAAAD